MARIHPDQNRCQDFSNVELDDDDHHHSCCDRRPSPSPSVLLTVWKRSSMSFQGTDGFTVFDCSTGRLAFRVDNYTRKDRCLLSTGGSAGLVLMDGSGKALLTLKPQMWSMQYQWNGYRGGEGSGTSSPKSREFMMRRRRSTTHSSSCREHDEAEVFMGGGGPKKESGTPDFKVEGSFRRRNCKIKSPSTGAVVAKIDRKRVNNTTILLSDDVFSLVVRPGFDPQLIMAFVIILDRICPKPFAPVLCS